jgi:ParB-like chromosome segregation protein Spo0J
VRPPVGDLPLGLIKCPERVVRVVRCGADDVGCHDRIVGSYHDRFKPGSGGVCARQLLACRRPALDGAGCPPPHASGETSGMPVKIKQYDIPDSAKMTIERVRRLGFTDFEFDPFYPVPPDVQRRVQIRNDEHYKPTAAIAPIAESMSRNEPIEPIVVTRDGYIVDGNTRVRAAHRAKKEFMEAVVLLVDWERVANTGTGRLLRTLGAGLNLKHGRGIDREETAQAILTIGADKSFTATRIAALLGVGERAVVDVLAEERARQRFHEVTGEVLNGSVPATQLRRLGGVAIKMKRDPFIQLVRLTQDAGLTVAELSSLIKRVDAADTEAEALSILEEERKVRAEQIREFIARGKARPPLSAQLRQRLGFVVDRESNPEALVENSPNFVSQHRDMIERAIAVLRAVLEVQPEVAGA